MIKEAIAHLLEVGKTAQRPEILKVPGEPDHVHHIISSEGRISVIENEPANRKITCTRLSDFVSLINKAGDEGYFIQGKMFLCVTQEHVRLIFDTTHGREYAEMPLTWTREFTVFDQLVQNPYLDPKTFRSMLRYECPETLAPDVLEKLMKQVSTFDAVTRARQDVAIERGGESLGTSVQSEVKGSEIGLPDEKVVFNVRLYRADDLPHRYPIVCMLDPDTAQNRWQLVPLEHSLLAMWKAAKDNIADIIKNGIDAEADVQITHADYSQAWK